MTRGNQVAGKFIRRSSSLTHNQQPKTSAASIMPRNHLLHPQPSQKLTKQGTLRRFTAIEDEYTGKMEPFLIEMRGELRVTVIAGEHIYCEDGKVNPYIRVGSGVLKKTRVKKDNANPRWNEELLWTDVKIVPGISLKFECWDYQSKDKDTRIGFFRIPSNTLLANETIERWTILTPRQKNENASGRIHFRVSFKTKDRPVVKEEAPEIAPRFECEEPAFMEPAPAPFVKEDEDDKAVDHSPQSLQVWRVENGKVVEWPQDKHGQFHVGDSYLILYTEYHPEARHFIYQWIGNESTSNEIEAVYAKSAELEKAVGGEVSSSSQLQDRESPSFLSLFNNNAIIYLEGGFDSTDWRDIAGDSSQGTRLLHIKGHKDNIRVHRAPLSYRGLNSGDCFLVDAGMQIWQWNGRECNAAERRKATDIMSGLLNERCGRPKIKSVDEGDEPEEFWALIGGKGPIATASQGGSDDLDFERNKPKLFRLSDSGGKLELTLVSVGTSNNHNLLDTNDVFLFDAGVEIFVWVGKASSPDEKRSALGWAKKYAADNQRLVPITRLVERGESDYFKAAFSF
ncbi:hypothetical protein PROFUN_05122 [Planoprotostelium fungivorum]|uniref:C2 domain-containing protein n=1 Tax=Planoprotostelium fungivorum TaxID=1890364 RepID=A0A2P6NRP7_9EUKA|nr:hypothetical protein PROFUN_05122 [Planoprotostelium fungivorum]